MIIAVADQCCVHGTLIAAHLAALREHGGHSVLALDAAGARRLASRFTELIACYHDIVIDTEGGDTPEGRAALAAANLVIVPVEAGQADLEKQYKLIARLNAARIFNPGLHVLFVTVGGSIDLTPAQQKAIRSYVAHVMSATLSATVIHDDPVFPGGRSTLMHQAGLAAAPAQRAAELRALYREVFVN